MEENSETKSVTPVSDDDNTADLPEFVTGYQTQAAAIMLFVVILIVAPLAIRQIYPFSWTTLFSDRPELFTLYRVEDEDGNVLPERNYGLQLNYDGNSPGVGAGITPPGSVNRFNDVESEEKIRQYVSDRMRKRNRDVLIVEQQIYGAIDDQQVGLTQRHRWRIEMKP